MTAFNFNENSNDFYSRFFFFLYTCIYAYEQDVDVKIIQYNYFKLDNYANGKILMYLFLFSQKHFNVYIKQFSKLCN